MVTVLWLIFGDAEHECAKRKFNGRTWLGGVNDIWFTVAGGESTAETIVADVWCRGWFKKFRIPASMIDNRDLRSIIDQFAVQSDGAIVMSESSIQMIESEALH